MHTSSLGNLTVSARNKCRDILRFCTRVPVSGLLSLPVLLAELGLKSIQDDWPLFAAMFWNSVAARPPDDIYKRMALDSCASAVARNRRNWARSMSS